MSANWRILSRQAGLEVRDNTVRVSFEDRRKQTVLVQEELGGQIRLRSIVVAAEEVQTLGQTNLRAWLRNRLSELVGFKIDEKGRLIGEGLVPTAGLKAPEWAFHVTMLARACDRFEYVLTGLDRDRDGPV